jgi:Ca2+-binding EF-hand superfamily protein
MSESRAEKLTPYQIMTHMQIKLEKDVSQKILSGFRNIVQKLDLDGNGQLNLDEYAKNPHFRGNPRGTRGFFGAADVNRDGQMSLNEYAWQRIITDEARKIFFAMDKNGNRHVSQTEFLQNKNIPSKATLEKIFIAFDTDENGELSLPECLRKWSQWARDGRKFGSLYK